MPRIEHYRQESLTGGLDTRNPDGNVDPTAYRLLVNVDGSDVRRMGRLPGWVRYGRGAQCYNNRDLHDQMLGGQTYQEFSTTAGQTFCVGPEVTSSRQCRESITFLKSISSPNGSRRLMAGTKSRLYVSDEYSGNWRIIADQLGGYWRDDADCIGAPERFKAATLGDITVLVNNVDPVIQWQFDAETTTCKQWSADYLYELAALSIQTAALVIEYKGFVLIANVVQDNVRVPNRIIWSDFNDALSWTPGSESLAGFSDLGASETITCWEVIGGKLRVYTDQAIYDAQLVVDSQLAQSGLTFAFTEIYRGSAVPKYPNTLVRDKSNHYYLGENTMYRMAEYDTVPTEFLWMRFAAGGIFGGIPTKWIEGTEDLIHVAPINADQCHAACAGWREKDGSLWFSFPELESSNPSCTLVVWPDNQKATIVDHGFTAFCQHAPSIAQSWRDFIGVNGVCDPADDLAGKEGSPCPLPFDDAGYSYLWNEADDGTGEMGGNAALSIFCEFSLEDFCKECKSDVKFVMACGIDDCLKEFRDDVFYREQLSAVSEATFPNTSVSVYQQEGYTTLLRVDASSIKTGKVKTARRVQVGYSADFQYPPSLMHCDVLGGEDPSCLYLEATEAKPMECNVAEGDFRSDSYLRFGCLTKGIYLAWQVWVSGVGGQFNLTNSDFTVIHDER